MVSYIINDRVLNYLLWLVISLMIVLETTFNETSLTLLVTNGTFPNDIKKTTLAYSHGDRNSNGSLTVIMLKINFNLK